MILASRGSSLHKTITKIKLSARSHMYDDTEMAKATYYEKADARYM